MLRIRRTSPIAAATLVAFLAALGTARAANPPSATASALAGSPAEEFGMLLRPAVIESIAAWGVSPEEVVRDVQGLGADELARVVGQTTRLAGPDWQRAARSQAMYLVLVAQVRESLLFERVVSRLSASAAATTEPRPARR